MKIGKLLPARFLLRINRFVCEVYTRKGKEKVLLKNTGRLEELLVEGAEVFLKRKNKGKYNYELFLVKKGKTFVCVNSHITPQLVVEYLLAKKSIKVRREIKIDRRRIDLLINDRELIETKSVNLVKESVALFPDAPTKRGTEHIVKLMEVSKIYRPAVFFVVQREDATRFSPNFNVDEVFSKTLFEFYKKGFKVKAFLCKVSLEQIYINKEIPVIFSN